MQSSNRQSEGLATPRSRLITPTVSGMLWATLAAFSYATMNVLLRAVATTDPMFSAWVRTIPVVLFAWGIIAIRAAANGSWREQIPAPSLWLYLVAAGLILNVTGNGSFQVALGIGGLALTIPVSQGAVLWGGAIASRILLGERVQRSTLLGIGLLVVALIVLTRQAGAVTTDLGSSVLATIAACAAGCSYGTGNTMLRRVVTRGLQPEGALAFTGLSGLVSLGIIALLRLGPEGMAAVTPSTLVVLLMAGAFNFIAFFSLTTALGRITVVRVSALSAAQTAISALAGVAIFAEPLTGALVAGLALTIGGIAIINRSRRPQKSPE